jgi:hypothetical protein
MESAIKSTTKERYIGFRENLNGPSSTIWVVGLVGFTKVPRFLSTTKEFSAKYPENMNKLKAIAPRIFQGPLGRSMLYQYSSTLAMQRDAKKMSGGGILTFGWSG